MNAYRSSAHQGVAAWHPELSDMSSILATMFHINLRNLCIEKEIEMPATQQTQHEDGEDIFGNNILPQLRRIILYNFLRKVTQHH